MLDMRQSLSIHGFSPIRYVTSDKPKEEVVFWEGCFPTVKEARLAANGESPSPQPEGELPVMAIDVGIVDGPLWTTRTINTAIQAARDTIVALPTHLRCVGLDAEWTTSVNASTGTVVRSSKVDVITVAYVAQVRADGSLVYRVLLLKVTGLSQLPYNLHYFFTDSGIGMYGCQIGGDVSKIARDFGAPAVKQHAIAIELGTYARKRDVVLNGSVGLQALAEVVLRRKLRKEGTPRISDWDGATLSREQIEYAALDALVSLQLCLELQQLPDLTVRVRPSDASVGQEVDVVLASGPASQMACRVASGKVVDPTLVPTLRNPTTQAVVNATSTRRIIKVDEVFAPSFVLPLPYNSRTRRTSTDDLAGSCVVAMATFGPPPFFLVLPLTNLAVSNPSGRSRRALVEAVPAVPAAAPAGTRQAAPPETSSTGGTPGDEPRRSQAHEAGGTQGHDHHQSDEVEDDYAGPYQRDGNDDPSFDEDDEGTYDDEVLDPADLSDATPQAVELMREGANALSGGASATSPRSEPDPSVAAESTQPRAGPTSDAAPTSSSGPPDEEGRPPRPDPPQLDPRVPVKDYFQTCSGDPFHYMDRVKVPMQHAFKKAYFVTLRDAFFIPHPEVKAQVEAVLRGKGTTQHDIEALWFYKFRYFAQRVPRHVPRPSILYERVRAVFALFGPLIDPATQKPLFNDNAWKKANLLLAEIARGFASDVPGEAATP